ncbi:hypothetical protein [Devosia lacusdianchii]|uniref:hypothetical protein n=1 Tax=Devosia lacusdianchii TaxID=2917991 RepID=UPI001F0680C9|nr:hypothetical protein [Devosia sp. JXJ CY 41]
MAKKLNDTEVWDRLHAALEALGEDDGLTTAGGTAIRSARRTLILLQMAVLKSQEAEQEPFMGQDET